MGSFNLACGVSNLSIGYGDRMATFLLMPNVMNTGDDNRMPNRTNLISNDGCFYFFNVACFPIFGIYDDYGRMAKIERDENVEALESYFDISIDAILSIVDTSRDIYSHMGEVFQHMFPTEHKKLFQDYKIPLDEKFIRTAGFIGDNESGFKHPDANENTLFLIDSERENTVDKNYRILNEDGLDLIADRGQGRGKDAFCKTWADVSDHYLFYTERQIKIIDSLTNMAGMVILRDIWDYGINCGIDKYSMNRINESVDKIVKLKELYSDDDNSDPTSTSNTIARWRKDDEKRTLRQRCIIGNEWSTFDSLEMYKNMEPRTLAILYSQFSVFYWMCYANNKLFMPTFSGPQCGDRQLENEFVKVVLKITEENLKDYDE